MDFEVFSPDSLLFLCKRTVERFIRTVDQATYIDRSVRGLPATYFCDKITPHASHVSDGDRITLMYGDDRQRWMCNIERADGLHPDLSGDGNARQAALRAADHVLTICKKVMSLPADDDKAGVKQLLSALRKIGDAHMALAAAVPTYISVAAETPWSAPFLEEADGKRRRSYPIEQHLLPRPGVSARATRNNGWVYLSLTPITVMIWPEVFAA
jgi:hypothetical protein